MSDLLPVVEAQNRIRAAFAPVAAHWLDLADALGRVLAEDVRAALDLPPFTNSSMDGYAVRAADLTHIPTRLRVVADIPAGAAPQRAIQPGEAARIMTGAMLPPGADAVAPVEDTQPDVDGVLVRKAVQPGDYLRPRGSDLQAGEVVLRAPHRLRAQDLGLLAALGVARVRAYRRPRVALLSSGDELVAPGEPLSPGKIYDANSITLASLVTESGADLVALGVARDDPAQVRERLQAAVRQGADLILTSAGVSVGAFDYVRAILEQEGKLTFWRVNVRPGKPLAFGAYQGVPVIGLPGNPVSAFVGFLIFAAPAIGRLAGLPERAPATGSAVLEETLDSDGRESYLRGAVFIADGQTRARQAKNQSSGNIYALSQANALLIVPSGVKSLPVGSVVNFIRIGDEGE